MKKLSDQLKNDKNRIDELTIAIDTNSAENDLICEMVNLREEQTGIKGVMFISTKYARHGPRVKYYQKAGRDNPHFSVSIDNDPKLLENSLPNHIVKQALPQVIDWVKLNNQDLLRFWNFGDTWYQDQVTDFVNGLKKLDKEQ